MTDTDTLDTPVAAPPPATGRPLDGEALWAGLQDAALVVLVVFLGVVLVGYKAHQSSAGSGAGAGAASGTIAVSLEEFAIKGNFNAPVGDVTFTITNDGTLTHDLVVTGLAKTAPIAAGGTDTLVVANLTPGTYEIFCDLPGHRSSGMATTLKVSYS